MRVMMRVPVSAHNLAVEGLLLLLPSGLRHLAVSRHVRVVSATLRRSTPHHLAVDGLLLLPSGLSHLAASASLDAFFELMQRV
jgi:hypothetical protein